MFDYTSQEAFAVETESGKEVETHGEQVTANLIKWYEQFYSIGLKRLEIWCHVDQKEHVQRLVDEFLRDKEKVADKIKVIAIEELDKPKQEQPAPEEATAG